MVDATGPEQATALRRVATDEAENDKSLADKKAD
jgi:hypothetical protein